MVLVLLNLRTSRSLSRRESPQPVRVFACSGVVTQVRGDVPVLTLIVQVDAGTGTTFSANFLGSPNAEVLVMVDLLQTLGLCSSCAGKKTKFDVENHSMIWGAKYASYPYICSRPIGDGRVPKMNRFLLATRFRSPAP